MNNLLQQEKIERILNLKKEKNAVILAHYYQIPEIQDIADIKGDSLRLAQEAATIDADIIVFCGVHFMAETAKILNRKTKVILPDLSAGCSLADSCPIEDFKVFKKNHPNHKVVSYINCSADVKTETDVVCTSGNALQIVESFPKEQPLIFAPDKNLGSYINSLSGRKMVLWDGTCEVHDQLKTEKLIQLKIENPDAKVVAHPECDGPILALADYIGSTKGMLDFCKSDDSNKFIVASETGILHQMQINSPKKEFIVVPADETCACNDCEHMKKNNIDNLLACLENESPEIILEENIMNRAEKPIREMINISKKLGII